MRYNLELEATIVEEYAVVERFLDQRGRRTWTATESRFIRYRPTVDVPDVPMEFTCSTTGPNQPIGAQ